jgi:hypothetical protein
MGTLMTFLLGVVLLLFWLDMRIEIDESKRG